MDYAKAELMLVWFFRYSFSVVILFVASFFFVMSFNSLASSWKASSTSSFLFRDLRQAPMLSTRTSS